MRSSVWLVAASLVPTLWLGAARANDDYHKSHYRPPPPERRGDFTVGGTLTTGFGVASGYPNEANQIDNPAFEQETGTNLALGNALWLGGALRDWFVVGFGVASYSGQTGSVRVNTTSFITHVELYPLYSLGGPFRDLAVLGDFGAGGGKIQRGTSSVADGGILSTLGGGVAYEALRWGGFAFGPSVHYLHQFSPSFQAHLTTLGFRVAFYASGS